jgi:hypothetical protein
MQTFSRWLLEQSQGKTLRSWSDVTVGQKLLGDIFASYIHDQREASPCHCQDSWPGIKIN